MQSFLQQNHQSLVPSNFDHLTYAEAQPPPPSNSKKKVKKGSQSSSGQPKQTLADQISNLFDKSTFDDQHRKYLSQGCLRKIITKTSIIQELHARNQQNQFDTEEIEELSSWFFENAIKIFAITIQCIGTSADLLQALSQIEFSEFKDENLPIDDPKPSNMPPPLRHEAFNDPVWTDFRYYEFFEKQWNCLVPVFLPEKYGYDLAAECIMPFERQDHINKGGAFSSVHRVRVHKDHHTHVGLEDVAIKKIIVGNGADPTETDKVWEIEARALSYINKLDHNSIVKCIAAIRRGMNRYFMFPWAGGNSLRDFWNATPKQAPDADTILEVIQQLRALADVLDYLHNIDHHQPSHTPIEQQADSPNIGDIPTVQVHGEEFNEVNDYRLPIEGGSLRHGDLKPENILRFLGDGIKLGQLKIADMGLAKRHVLATQDRAQRTTMTYGTLRYEAPEAVTAEYARSRLYDIWSMGCVTFEFIIWTLYGNDRLTLFYTQAAAETQKEWQYYELLPGDELQQADLNRALKRWISHLEDFDPECRKETKSALSDLLKVVREKLLVISLPPGRSSAIGSSGGGRTLQPPTLGESRTRYRATAAEFRTALDEILQKCSQPGYLFTGKDRSRIPVPSIKVGSLQAPSQRRAEGSKVTRVAPSNGVVRSGILGRPVDYSLPPLEDWTFHVDNSFADKILNRIGLEPFLLPSNRAEEICPRCLDLNIWSAGFSLELPILTLRQRSKSCQLCKMLLDAYDTATGVKGEMVRFERNQSVIIMTGHRFPVLSVFRSPKLNPPFAVQLGLAQLPQPGSDIFFDIAKSWLQDCDDNHPGCVGTVQCELPTRLIEVGTVENPLLRLVETRKEIVPSKDYVALSHPWGDTTKYTPFSTLRNDPENNYDVKNFKRSIPYNKLPATFKHAVDCTRQLGIPYIWIDSICIIQGPGGDFGDEAKRMEDVFSGAYCVIAASRAIDQRTGFLAPRPQGEYVTMTSDDGKPFYICKTIDNFNKDVIEGRLNRRGWVLQERALARRTIYFTENQTYFECGNGVRCETLTWMQNNMADFLGDPQFPNKAMRAKSRALKIEYFQGLYKQYSRLELTRAYDRPFAISGLEKRLQKAFDSKGTYGTFDDSDKSNPGLFRRSILWQRDRDDDPEDKNPMKHIEFPADRNVQIPSWSWMAYEGSISYCDPPFGTADWDTKDIISPWCDQDTTTKSAPQTSGLPLTVIVRDFDLRSRGRGRDEVKVVYDTNRTTASDGQRSQCVIVARSKEERSDRERVFYVLLVGATGGHDGRGKRIYKRVGAGFMLGKFISLDKGVEGKVY